MTLAEDWQRNWQRNWKIIKKRVKETLDDWTQPVDIGSKEVAREIEQSPIIGRWPDDTPMRAPIRNRARSWPSQAPPPPPHPPAPDQEPAEEFRRAFMPPGDRQIADIVAAGPRSVDQPEVAFVEEEIAKLVVAKPQARRIYLVDDEAVMGLLVLADGTRGRPGHFEHGMLGQPLYVGMGHTWSARRNAQVWNQAAAPDDQIEVIELDEVLRRAAVRSNETPQ